ncbi:MAG: hypothetical protein K5837_01455 [Candidatus Saccharibacteria bacterium]|nr:hypothetical protein [Candidatus Saccharibacteria bacterium]
MGIALKLNNRVLQFRMPGMFGVFFSPHPKITGFGGEKDPKKKKGFFDRLGEILYKLFG